jgi:hypothetical protein
MFNRANELDFGMHTTLLDRSASDEIEIRLSELLYMRERRKGIILNCHQQEIREMSNCYQGNRQNMKSCYQAAVESQDKDLHDYYQQSSHEQRLQSPD